MPHALQTFRIIAVTATVTSAIWVSAGAYWLQRSKPVGASHGPMAMMAARPGMAARPAEPAGLQRVSRQGDVLPQPGRLRIPVVGVRAEELVDTFTQARENGARVHDAIDILAPRGTPVIAAAPGRVEKLFLSKAGGNTVYVRSPDGTLLYYYAHLDAYAPTLREGAVLAAGEPVGTVGFTGNADPAAPHLHFAVLATTPQARWWERATAINPYPLLGGR